MMRLPRFTLWQMMLVVALIAVNLAAFLFVARPFNENLDLLYLTLGTVPMLDALVITGWLVVTRRRPFLVGFLYWGAAAVATYVYCYLATKGIVQGWCRKTSGDFYGFCVHHNIPGHFAPRGSPAFYRFFFPALAPIISAPQFTVALFGGVLEAAVSRAFRGWRIPHLALIRTIVLLAVLAVVGDLGPRRSAEVMRVAAAGAVTLLALHVWWHHRRSGV